MTENAMIEEILNNKLILVIVAALLGIIGTIITQLLKHSQTPSP